MIAGVVEACGRLLPFFQKVFKSIQEVAIDDLGVAEVRRDRMQMRDGALHGSAGLSGREELFAEVLVHHFVDVSLTLSLAVRPNLALNSLRKRLNTSGSVSFHS